MRYTLHSETIEANGLTFKVEIEQDDSSGRPWEECEGHGPVREAHHGPYDRNIAKTTGERILHVGGRHEYSWVYDWNGAIKQAKKEGWGVSPENRTTDWGQLTPRQQREVAVQRDFDFLKAWCDNTWVYAGICVTLMAEDDDGEPIEYSGPLDCADSLWSVEFWQYVNLNNPKNSYALEIANEMIASITKTYRTEQAERLACEERDIATVPA